MKQIIIIHYAEIALKGDNRREFENKLVENTRHVLKDFKYEKIKRISGRILIYLESEIKADVFLTALGFVFGISHYSFGIEAKADMVEIEKTLDKILRKKIISQPKDKKAKTFRITARRADKNFPLTSDEINYKVGEYVFEKSGLGLKVNLKNPDLNCFIEIIESKALVYFEKIPALGGLPVGTSGKVLSLISSGFDSPVAAWHLMKRGARVDFIHFHSYPRTGKESINNVKNIVQILNRYQILSNLYLVPLLDIQREIFSKCEGKYRILLYRRFMMRIAERVASDIRAGALVTGESLGQVASQTLENIRVTDNSVSLPVFRPLIGMDKVEIINGAKKIGTYEISSQPYEDCCSLFTPLHPATKAKLKGVEFEESKLDSEKLTREAMNKIEKIEI